MKIKMHEGRLIVPNEASITYIEGDGVSQDIFPAAKNVFDWAVKLAYAGEKKIDWIKLTAGQTAFETTGDYLPDTTLEAIQSHLISIKGPLMTPVGEGFRSINVSLRQKLDLFACVRPVEYFAGINAPIKHPEDVNMTIFRENTEDIYAGIEFASGSIEAQKLTAFLAQELQSPKIRFDKTSALGIKPVSPDGSKRLVRAAFDYAVSHKKQRLTIVHKGNIMKFTEGGFRKWAYEVAEDYPTFTKLTYEAIKAKEGVAAAEAAKAEELASGLIYVDDVIADNFLQQIIINPEQFQVIATLNLNGDYLSDALAAEVGGIGIAPGANINYQTGHAIFEATHGTAPDLAGQNVANPSSLILSGLMMFEYLGWFEAAEQIRKALSTAILEGQVTQDLGGKLLTSQFSDLLIEKMKA